MIQKIIFCLGVFFFTVDAQETCYTPTRDAGECINLNDCDSLMQVFKGPKPIPESSLKILRASHCGFDGKTPKVCCKSANIQQSEAPQHSQASAPDSNTERITITSSTNLPPASSSSTFDPPDVSSHPNLRFLNHSICGPITQSKIVNGNKTGVLDYPWMALIAYNINGRKEFRCGGSIINDKYILTAAHCLTELPQPLAVDGVRVGEHNLSTERDCDRDKNGLEIVCADGYQDFGVESFLYHSEYSSKTLKNDIGLIRVDGRIDFSPINVKPICLPIGSAIRLGSKKVTVLGWGATDIGPRSQDLLKVTIPRVSNEECASSYPSRISIWEKQICAGGKDGKDSCGGDSGGPMLAPAIYNSNVRFVQYGIVSFGPRNCGTEGIPGVYTRVTHYMDWILNSMRD
ncbi:phenoloxidase-activating factor 1-like [Chelonus insularis]|uniref:phenoloxidase-activating factor 1-like n=1 Tax=Chelonus insularis TaxID=460826 RepID=UPI00158E086D|nr:phenoloxidase-activating factor 1-like [Chelonus insularis]